MEELNLLLALLNDTETHGKKNLNNLLAAIQLVEGMAQRKNEEQSQK